MRNVCVVWLSLIFLIVPSIGFCGSLNDPAGPTDTASAMYTLEDIYNWLDSGTAGTPRIFTEPAAVPPTSTMRTLNDVMGKAPAKDDTDGATAAQVMTGKKFWGLRTGEWGLLTGTMADQGAVTITPGTTDHTIAAGYHNGSGKVEGDSYLTGGNIMAGTTLFGIVGKCRKLPATGQTKCYQGVTPWAETPCTGTGQRTASTNTAATRLSHQVRPRTGHLSPGQAVPALASSITITKPSQIRSPA